MSNTENVPAMEKPVFDPSQFEGESQTQKLARKSREAPFMTFGLLGCGLACLYGAYRYKNRGSMSTSVYLMQLRVAAQGTVVAALTFGVGYTLFKHLYYDEAQENKTADK
ncbi:HIG1 domain family member 1A, mitochondrial-like [Limulus polyphemus]|uniref:HIG1 domain family member 1A, mitochondrial-like n=1 Tax=Limulus polyphemus TaxID=6850 RepID=A0ABM1SFS3_LIMPO|nr:HIG1 domain family member 1A, mitochondrial-like [Limulus polyphemus]XP_022242478.1 HIG1 domain family member 1A, mitochondrial-like [Limulus polyphemus]